MVGARVRGCCAGAEGRGPQPHARRAAGTHSARGRAGVGGGCAGPRPAATIPPAAPAAESRAAAAPARRLGRLGCRRSGRPCGRPRAGEGLSPRCGRNLGSGTRPAQRLPRAPHTPFFASAPPRPPSGPPGSTFLPSFPLPFSPIPGPRPAATRSAYGGAGRGEFPARPAPPPRGDRPGTPGGGRPGGSPFRRTRGGGSEPLGVSG